MDPGKVIVARTTDRSVHGCMNDMAFTCQAAADRSSGLAGTDIGDVNQALRRNINSACGYTPPIELTTPRLRSTSRNQKTVPGSRTVGEVTR